MEFNEEEIKEIEGAAQGSVAVRKLWEQHKRLSEDAGAKFYKSLLLCTGALSAELEAVHSGSYNKLRLLESKPQVWKRVFALLKDSGKIREGLELNKAVFKSLNGKKEKEVIEDDISITDRIANNSKK